MKRGDLVRFAGTQIWMTFILGRRGFRRPTRHPGARGGVALRSSFVERRAKRS
jgi:hypothetical protein